MRLVESRILCRCRSESACACSSTRPVRSHQTPVVGRPVSKHGTHCRHVVVMSVATRIRTRRASFLASAERWVAADVHVMANKHRSR